MKQFHILERSNGLHVVGSTAKGSNTRRSREADEGAFNKPPLEKRRRNWVLSSKAGNNQNVKFPRPLYSIASVGVLLSLTFAISSFAQLSPRNQNDENVKPRQSLPCDSCPLCPDEGHDEQEGEEKTGIYDFSSNRITYFQNLSTYSPLNSHGSCGFVSLIQYMTYYDTFWNDSIVPDAYERCDENALTASDALATSPGVCQEPYPAGGMALYLYCSQTESYNFQSKCMRAYNTAAGISEYQFSYSIGMWNYQLVFDYLYGANAVNFSFVSYESYSSDPSTFACQAFMRQQATAYLSIGKPVILHIGQWNANTQTISDYHSVVAYDYSDGEIWCNYGWNSSSTHLGLGTNQILQVGLADFETWNHVHSYNYVVDGIRYCPCGAHKHSYDDHYAPMNPYYHYEYCWCGAYTVQSHAMVANEGGAAYHCRYCSYAE